jgi:WD40 repeat protein
VRAFTLTPDGQRLLTADVDGFITTWTVATGRVEARWAGAGPHTCGMGFTEGGRGLATADWDGRARLSDPSGGKLRRSFKHGGGPINSITSSPDGRLLATGGWDATVRLWDAATGSAIRTLSGHRANVIALAFAPDGRTLASAGSDVNTARPEEEELDLTVRLWDVTTGVENMRARMEQPALSLAFAPDGRTLAVATGDSVRLLNPSDGKELARLEGRLGGVNCVRFSPDGKLLASGGNDNAVQLWDTTTRRRLRSFAGHSAPVNELVFGPTNTLASGSADGSVILWSVPGQP